LPAVLNSTTFLPFATITRVATFAIFAASSRPSFFEADTISTGLMRLASRNLDALTQEVQPLRW
jgi:hypothetical protein